MTTPPHAVDVRRRAGWLPEDQDDLESWLDGHRERVEARGEQVVLHPVLTEFQELIDADPVVRMYIHQMIAQVISRTCPLAAAARSAASTRSRCH